MKIFSSRILFPPLSAFCLCILVLELSGKCTASENVNPNATSRAFTHPGTGQSKKAVWRNHNSVKRDSGYGDSSGQYNSNSNSNTAAIAAVLNSDGNSGQQQQQSSFDSYASSSYDEGKAMGSNYQDSYGVPSPSSSYGVSDYGHMMHEPSSMKYHYKVIPHQETSGMGWGEEDDGDSGIKEIVGVIKGIKGIKALKGLKGLGLLSLPLLPILIPLILAIPLLPIIAIAGLFFFFPIPIITMPTRIGTAGTGTGTAGTNPISQVFPALFPINVGGRTSQELWNGSNLNESEQFLSRAASRILNEENYFYSHFDYIRNMVKAVAQEIYFSSTRTSRGLKDSEVESESASEKNQSQNKKNQCLERMACELTTFLKKISPKSSSFISGTMKKVLGSGDNSISRQIRTGMSSSPIEISGSEVKVKSCKERFSCERLREESPPTDQKSKVKTTA